MEHILGSCVVVEGPGSKENSHGFKGKKLSFDFSVICRAPRGRNKSQWIMIKMHSVSILLVLQFALVVGVPAFT